MFDFDNWIMGGNDYQGKRHANYLKYESLSIALLFSNLAAAIL